ncbi:MULTISPECIES: NnrS family protein [unclassified Marinobacterium]|uniref:NnrS family protein n=1 Tax=unclassified Marinobacterium TaxID=2644139 RepID=UPI001A019566|nr:NnrS protein [Marinobacterium sp. xm-v-242]NRP77182.1 NnrS protein [Marinobacterium sp. xm-m-383]
MALLQIDGSITEENNTKKHHPAFLNAAFRPFFLLGAAFAALSIPAWALSFLGLIEFKFYGGAYAWHLHEMLFGFFPAIMVGFLLTAVQTWTKRKCIEGWWLAALVLTWLLGRITLAFQPVFFRDYTIVIDLLFLPACAVFLARPILQAKMWRNLFFVPILLVMAMMNTVFHFSLSSDSIVDITTISHAMVILAALVMSIMGGRVFPMFTANGTKTPRVNSIRWLEQLSILSIVIVFITTLAQNFVPNTLSIAVLFVAGISNLVRALRWRLWVTFKVPLVWSLHLSYLAMSLGFILLALAKMHLIPSVSIGFHSITVGGMGLMILSMISRVSLGHTGLLIKANIWVICSLLALSLAAIDRVTGSLFGMEYSIVIASSALLWSIGFLIFVFAYTKILFTENMSR